MWEYQTRSFLTRIHTKNI